MNLLASFARLIEQIYDGHIESFFYKSRRLRRLAPYGIPLHSAPPLATIDLAERLTCIDPLCDQLRLSYGGFYARLCTAATSHSALQSDHMLLTAIDLKKFADYPTYYKALRKRSGNFCRDALKAKRLGYRIAGFDRDNHATDIRNIHRSMKTRSFGLVLEAIFPFSRASSVNVRNSDPANIPACAMHWDVTFGVFIDSSADGQTASAAQSTLVGYACLQRIGNVVAYADLIGHGEHLHNGIMMLLHTEILAWLLNPENLHATGVDYLTNGTLERGNEGMFFWKKKALFAPCLVQLIEQPLPEDFDASEYLRLNPDVAMAREDAASHYKKHGRKEQRRYRATL